MVISYSVFPTLLSISWFNVFLSLVAIFLPCDHLKISHLGIQEELFVAQIRSSGVVWNCTLYLQVTDLFVCFPCPVFLWQLSERARERKVPVTRIGRLANFGGEFAHLHLQSHYDCTDWWLAVTAFLLKQKVVPFSCQACWLESLSHKWVVWLQSLIWAFSLPLWLLAFSQKEVTLLSAVSGGTITWTAEFWEQRTYCWNS